MRGAGGGAGGPTASPWGTSRFHPNAAATHGLEPTLSSAYLLRTDMAPRRGRPQKAHIVADPALQQAKKSALLDARHKKVSKEEIRALTELATERAVIASEEYAHESDSDEDDEPHVRRPYVYDGTNPRFRNDSKAVMLRDLLTAGIERFGYPRPCVSQDAWFAEAGVPVRHRYQQQQQWQAGPRLGYPGLYCPWPGAEPPRNPRDELMRELYVVGMKRFGTSFKMTASSSSSKQASPAVDERAAQNSG